MGLLFPCGKRSKSTLRKLRFLRTFLHYGGYELRYDLQIPNLPSVPWADASPYFCAQSYRGTSLPATPPTTVPAACGCPVASRHSARRSGGEGADQNHVPLDDAPLKKGNEFCRARRPGAPLLGRLFQRRAGVVAPYRRTIDFPACCLNLADLPGGESEPCTVRPRAPVGRPLAGLGLGPP